MIKRNASNSIRYIALNGIYLIHDVFSQTYNSEIHLDLVRSCESEIAPRTLCLYLLAIFFKQFKYISVVFFANVIDYNPCTSLMCKNEKNVRISLRKYASKLTAGAILDSHGCMFRY